MEIVNVIKGQVVTEKAEKLKLARTYTLLVDPRATKIDVKSALKKHYDIDATSVRVIRTRPKTRRLGGSGEMEKRHRAKKMMVTISAKSKPLDITTFKIR